VTRPLIQWPGLVVLLILGFWAGHGQSDSVIRQDFTLQTPGHASFAGVVLRPRSVNAWSDAMVIYAHAAGGSLSNDVPELRRLAELGLAAVSLDYDQTNHAAFHAQFDALQAWLNQQEQSWANTRAVAWLGLSLGANHFMDEALRHEQPEPQVLILLSSQGLTGSFTHRTLAPFHHPVLLLQGEQDHWFPWTDTEQLYLKLTGEGVPVAIKGFPGLGHGLEPDRGVILRCLGEYCLSQLAGTNWWRNYHSPAESSVGPAGRLCWLSAMLWLLSWNFWGRRAKRVLPAVEGTLKAGQRPALRLSFGVRVFATVLVAWVLAVNFIYVIIPQLPVDKFTLAIAQRWMVPLTEKADFDYLSRQPAWAGKPLKTCIEQIQLAGYVRHHFNLRGDDAIYREYCLSPFITGRPGETGNWRRTLWAEFDPDINAETDPVAAASGVVRHLRENVSVLNVPGLPEDVSGIWRRRVTNAAGFEIIYVAALRSAGIPARLDANHLAELWNGTGWQTAPAPALLSW